MSLLASELPFSPFTDNAFSIRAASILAFSFVAAAF
jgi:hypothetical protein